jgi:hypothetical protein
MMGLFSRQLTRRFLRATGLAVLVLVWLVLIVDASPSLSSLTRAELLLIASRVLGSTEMAFALAAPLGIMLTVLELKRAGILSAFMAAGLSPQRLRRVLLGLCAGTVVCSALMYEATVRLTRAASPEAGPSVYHDQGVYLWPLESGPGSDGPRRVILFRRDSLDVSSARASWISPGKELVLTDPRALSGPLISLDRFRIQPSSGIRLFAFPSLTEGLLGRTSPALTLSALNRILLGGVLLLLLAYVSLLTPIAWQWVSVLALMLAAPAVALGMLACTIGLATPSVPAYLAEIVWLAVLIGLAAGLEALFRRRGLRQA